jgi:hypothetical protein
MFPANDFFKKWTSLYYFTQSGVTYWAVVYNTDLFTLVHTLAESDEWNIIEASSLLNWK